MSKISARTRRLTIVQARYVTALAAILALATTRPASADDAKAILKAMADHLFPQAGVGHSGCVGVNLGGPVNRAGVR